jgi:hypothetical protein
MMAGLMALALFWGNCLSCPQVLLSSNQPAHACCHRTHQPAPQTNCQSQSLQHFVQAEKGAVPVPVVAALVNSAAPWQAPRPTDTGLRATVTATPPGYIPLTSSLRI